MNYEKNVNELKNLLHDKSLLYVEDNHSLSEKGVQFFNKFFKQVYKAEDGENGLKMFNKYRPDVVVTDIKMPKANGLEMSNNIRKLDKDVKIIITSAFDTKEYLLETINIGVDGYMVKPIAIDNMLDVLKNIAKDIHVKKHSNNSIGYIDKIFDNHDDMLIMLNDKQVVKVNNAVLDFFGLKDLSEFRKMFKNFGSLFLEQDTFLYEKDGVDYLDELKKNQGKIYNVKIRDKENKIHHLLIKLTSIPDEENFFLISLNDVTQLNLLPLYEKSSDNMEDDLDEKNIITELLESAVEAQARLDIYNSYNGLAIIHEASIKSTSENHIVLKTEYVQLKAIEFEKKLILTSDHFPNDIEFDDIKHIDFKKQTVEVAKPLIMSSTPTKRKNITIIPDPNYVVTLFYEEHKFETEISLLNISVNSIRLSLKYLPSGFKVDDRVTIDIVFNGDYNHLIINTTAKVYRIFEQKDNFEVVLILDKNKSVEKSLVNYISKRQMTLIQEFKGIEF